MRNKRKIWLMISALALFLAACGDGMTPEEREAANRQQEGIEVVGIPIDDDSDKQQGEAGEQHTEKTELEQQIQELERRCGTPDFAQEEYVTLAKLYSQNGQVRKQRDTLEICYALYRDSSAGEQLQQLTVNVSEEDAGVQEQMNLLGQNISTQGYVNEAVSMLHGEEWKNTMMPRLTQGSRSYYQEQGGNSLYVRTGYDASGAFYTQVQYQQEDQITVLLQTEGSVQLLETSMGDAHYDGVYECWTVLAASGDVIRENGNLRDGVMVGDYTAQVRWGKGESELLPLWNMREDMEMVTYNGSFGEDGISSAAQLEESDVIIYAYDRGKQNYLFMSAQEDAAANQYVFRAESLGMPAPETYVPYVPMRVEDNAGPTEQVQLQVRVFDGNIEVYDGTGWVNMGSVQTYIEADPVVAGSQAAEGETPAGEEGQGIAAVYARRGGGEVKPQATPKPTSRPAATPKPNTPAPTPAPTPQPSNPQPSNPQPSNPDPAPQPSNPDPAPQPTPEPPAPQPTPEPPAPTDPPITGGDSDVEWSPDMM